jgi:hypothetical protein
VVSDYGEGENMKICILSILLFLSVGVSASKLIETANVNTITNLYDLEALFVDKQYQFLPISPPMEEVYVHRSATVIPLDWPGFPETFAKGMYAEMHDDLFPLYRVTIYEDPISRDTVFLNVYGIEIYRLTASEEYDPYAWQTIRFNLESGQVLDSFQRWIFDSAHISIEFLLIPEIFHTDYLAVQQQEAMSSWAMAPITMFSSSMAQTNIQLAICTTTNGTIDLEFGNRTADVECD